MATGHDESSFQMKQINQFLGWCRAHDVVAEHRLNQREWRW
ncbi:hypothetical protein [Microtetraspora malaysiensis]